MACVLIPIAGFGCGGSDDSGGQTAAEERNQAMIAEAQSETNDVSGIRDALRLNLATYPYAGVDETFALPDGSLCSIGQILGTEEEVAVYVDDPDTLVSPEGDFAVRISKFQGTERAPCLEAVGEALDWLGTEEVVPETQELAKAEFREEADSVCRSLRAHIEGLYGPDEGSLIEEARVISAMRPRYLDGIETLESLVPPPELSADFDSYLTAMHDQVEIFDREQAAEAAIYGADSIGEKVAAADKVALKRAYVDSEDNFETRNRLAESIGFKVCSSD